MPRTMASGLRSSSFKSHSPTGSVRSDLRISAHRVRELHLPRRLALRLEETRARDQDAGAPGPGGRHIQPIQVVEKLHPSRSVFWPGSGHGIDDDGCLLPLEAVDGADADAAAIERL